MKRFIFILKAEWKRFLTCKLTRLIYMVSLALIFGKLGTYFDIRFLRILALLPLGYLVFEGLVFLVYGWIINPINDWKKRKNEKN